MDLGGFVARRRYGAGAIALALAAYGRGATSAASRARTSPCRVVGGSATERWPRLVRWIDAARRGELFGVAGLGELGRRRVAEHVALALAARARGTSVSRPGEPERTPSRVVPFPAWSGPCSTIPRVGAHRDVVVARELAVAAWLLAHASSAVTAGQTTHVDGPPGPRGRRRSSLSSLLIGIDGCLGVVDGPRRLAAIRTTVGAGF